MIAKWSMCQMQGSDLNKTTSQLKHAAHLAMWLQKLSKLDDRKKFQIKKGNRDCQFEVKSMQTS